MFMTELIWHVLMHAVTDTLRLVPFLFLTYLVMEYLEHKTQKTTQEMIRKAGKLGPLIGGIAGVFPQCGFSAAASSFYAGGVIAVGTLMAVFLSTSDEMLPILISEKQPLGLILNILSAKILIGAAAGFLIDIFLFRKSDKEEHHHIHDICAHEHCHCEKGILRSAVSHTLQITFFIILITFVMNVVLHFVGEEALAELILNRPVLGPILAGAVGLIPNCAASVAITQLYLSGAMSTGAMMSGLLSGAGAGLLVLFRANHNKKENLKIVCLLYAIGVLTGIVIEWVI